MPQTDNALLSHLLNRRSVPAKVLSAPGPDREALDTMLTIAARVPDHKMITPWRFIVLEGAARAAFGNALAAICRHNEADASDMRLDTERGRFDRAPVVVAVVSSPVEHPACPEWEQFLSAGAVCLNLLHAASAMGFGAQWVTEWYSFDDQVGAAFGLKPGERFAGFIYIGAAAGRPEDRKRPDLSSIVSRPDAPITAL